MYRPVLLATAILTLLASPALAQVCTISWTGPSGDWSDISGWDLGRLPIATDVVCITQDAFLVVDLDVDTTIAGLVVGSATGIQSQFLGLDPGTTMTLNGDGEIRANGSIAIDQATIDGTGSITSAASSNTMYSGTIATPLELTTGLLNVDSTGNSISELTVGASAEVTLIADDGGDAELDCPQGLLNSGTLRIGNEAYTAGPKVTLTGSGGAMFPLENLSGGLITIETPVNLGPTAIDSDRKIDGQLQNAGSVEIQDRTVLTLTGDHVYHLNESTISVAGQLIVDLTDSGRAQAPSSFSNYGTIDISASSDGMQVACGTTGSWYQDGSAVISGGGAFDMAECTIDGAWAQDRTGPVSLLNSTLLFGASIANSGSLTVNGTFFAEGDLSNATGSTLAVAGTPLWPVAELEFTSDLVNDGDLLLQATESVGGAALLSSSGSLIIGSGGTLTAGGSSFAGYRRLEAQVVNQGSITVDQPLELLGEDFVHENSGQILLTGGDLSLDLSVLDRAPSSFTNLGTIEIGTGRTLSVHGSSALSRDGEDFVSSGLIEIATGGVLTLDSATFAVPSAGTVTNGGSILLHGSNGIVDGTLTTTTGSLMEVAGDEAGGAALTFSTGLTSSGVLRLGNVDPTAAERSVALTCTGDGLIIASGGELQVAAGTGGGERTFTGQLTSFGAIAVEHTLAMTGDDAAHVNELGATFRLTGGDVSLDLPTSDRGPSSFTNLGTIEIGTGRSFLVSGNQGRDRAPSSFTNSGTIEIGSGSFTFSSSGLKLNASTPRAPASFTNSGTLEIGAGGSFNLSFSGGRAPSSFTNSGTLDIGSGGLMLASGGSTVFNAAPGEVVGSGTIDAADGQLSSAGTIRPGDSPGALEVRGDLALLDGSLYEVELAGPTPGSEHDQLSVSAAVVLDGAIEVVVLPGFTPTVGDAFDVLPAGSTSGAFTDIVGTAGACAAWAPPSPDHPLLELVSAGVDLELTATGSHDPVSVDIQELTWTFTVTNDAGMTATGVVINSTWDAAATVVGSDPAGACSPDTATSVTCDVPSIAGSGSSTILLTVQPTEVGTLTNTATVSSDQCDPVVADDTDTVVTEVVGAQPCDADGNGAIEVADVPPTARWIFGDTSAAGNPDCGGDGGLDAADLIALIDAATRLRSVHRSGAAARYTGEW